MPTSADYGQSSVRKMSWAALLGTERLLDSAFIREPWITALLDHIWRYSTVDGESFPSWVESGRDLADIAMESTLPSDIAQAFEMGGIRVEDGRVLLQGVTEIIYTSLYGAVDWTSTNQFFDSVVEVLADYEHGVPDPQALPESLRSERSGWGTPVDVGTCELIRRLSW